MEDVHEFRSSNRANLQGNPYAYQQAPFPKGADFEAYFGITTWDSADPLEPAGANSFKKIMSSSTTGTGSSSSEEESSSAIKARIFAHPLYSKLLEAYIDCQKVGAPSETAKLLDEILQENQLLVNNTGSHSHCLNEDPELDEFMETYCNVLGKCKLDLEGPYDEASKFLSNMETQLINICSNSTPRIHDDQEGRSSNEDGNNSELEVLQEKSFNESSEVKEIKEKLLMKYSGYIRSLRHEFYRKKKKGKLPKDARQTLMNWWTLHCDWPYPTEPDKIGLASSTGLDQKQINNWFINQRKRHWKPPENIEYYSSLINNNEDGSFFLSVD